MFSIDDLIDLAIQLEHNGETIYREAMKSQSGPSLALMFKWMADEERKHAHWFEELRTGVTTAPLNAALQEMSRGLLGKILGNQGFSLADVDFSKIKDARQLLGIMVEFEKDTILFYEILRECMDDTVTVDILETIMREENRHVDELNNLAEKAPGPTVT